MRLSQARWKVLQAGLLVALGLTVAACGGRDTLKDPASPEGALPMATVAAPTGAPSSSATARPVAAGVVTEQTFCSIFEAIEAKTEARIDAAVQKKDLTDEEFAELFSHFTPEGTPDDFTEILAALGLRPEDIPLIVSKADPKAAGRCTERVGARLNEAFKRAEPVLGPRIEAALKAAEPLLEQERKLQVAWREDIGQARADAMKQKKPALVVFCAEWDGACRQMDKTTFRDANVRALLAQDVVPVRVDATDDEAPSVKKVSKEYKVLGLPTLVIFDAQGRERRRFVDGQDGATLAAALRDAMKAR